MHLHTKEDVWVHDLGRNPESKACAAGQTHMHTKQGRHPRIRHCKACFQQSYMPLHISSDNHLVQQSCLIMLKLTATGVI